MEGDHSPPYIYFVTHSGKFPMVPQEGIEPSTSPLPRECSTSKLLWQSPSNGTTGYTKLQKIKGCRKTGAGNQGECVVT